MYSFLEIEAIFRNCQNWEELKKSCQCFLWVLADGDITVEQKLFIQEQSNKRYREIENI